MVAHVLPLFPSSRQASIARSMRRPRSPLHLAFRPVTPIEGVCKGCLTRTYAQNARGFQRTRERRRRLPPLSWALCDSTEAPGSHLAAGLLAAPTYVSCGVGEGWAGRVDAHRRAPAARLEMGGQTQPLKSLPP